MLGPALRHVLLFARGLFSDGLSLSIGTIADGDYLRRSGNEIIGDTVSGGGAPSAHASTHQNGGADEIATATPGANAIPKANSSGKLAAGWGGAASTLATLNSSSKVVEDPANATATPTASKIPIADGSGKLASGWLTEVLALADLSDVSAKSGSGSTVMLNDGPTVATYLAFTDAAGSPASAGRLQRNGANVEFHDGTAARVMEKQSNKGAASGYASLNSSSKVVEDPANATATPTASKIPIADGSGKLAAGWGGSASTLATLDSSAQVVEPVNKIRTSAPGSPASGDVWFASPDLRWCDGGGSTQTAMRGSGGGTDNAVLRADGTGNAVQGSSLILGDDGQMDVGDIRTMPHSTVAWNTGVAVVIDVGTLQNGDYDVWVRFWCERIVGGTARKVWTEHMAVRRTAGSPSILNNGSVGSLGSYGPPIAYAWSGDDLTITITSAGHSGKLGYQVTLIYQGDTTT